jgi:hypothetical protein
MVFVEVDCWPQNAFKHQVSTIIEAAGFQIDTIDHVFLLDTDAYEAEPIVRWTFDAKDRNTNEVAAKLEGADAIRILLKAYKPIA